MPSDNLRSLHQSMFSELFATVTAPEGMIAGKTRVSFASLGQSLTESMRQRDIYGEELKVTEAVGTSKITGLSLSRVSKGIPGISYTSRHYVQPEVAQRVLQTIRTGSPGTANIIMAWDKELQGGSMKGLTTGVDNATVVPVKKIFQRYFGDLGITSSKLEHVIEQAKAAPKAGAVKYLQDSIALLEDAHGSDLSPSQMVQAVFNAAFMRAREANQNSMYGLSFFKQTLQNLGVPGLSEIPEQVFSTTDPYGMANIINGIKPGSKDRAYLYLGAADSSMTAGQMKRSFFDTVKYYYGDVYAKSLSNTYKTLSNKAGTELALAISGQGGIYIGKHGELSSFRPIAAEVMGPAGTASRAGLISGMVTVGDKVFGSRNIYSDGGITYLSQHFLHAFEEGALSFGAGINSRSIPGAIAKAKKHASSGAKMGMSGATFEDLRQPLRSRGRFSMYSALYNSHSFSGGRTAFGGYRDLHKNLNKLVINGLLTPGQASVLEQSLAKDFEQSMHKDAYANKLYPAIKPKVAIDSGVIALPSVEDLFLPGVMFTKRAMTKGLYQAGGVEERWIESDLARLRSSRRAAGLGHRASTLALTRGNMRMMDSLHRAYREGGSVSKRLGATRGYGAIMFTGATEVHDFRGPYGELYARELFGDAGAIMTRTGSSMFQTRHVTLQKVMRANRMQYTDYLMSIAGDQITSPGWQKLLSEDPATLLAGGSSVIFEQPLLIGNKKLAPRGAHFLTGISGAMNRSEVKFNFSSAENSVPGAMAFLANQMTRMTARNVPRSALDVLPGMNMGARADMVTSVFNLNPKDPSTLFYHRINLLQTKQNIKKSGRRFVKDVNRLAGYNMLQWHGRGEAYITPAGKDLDYKLFKRVSALALMQQGFTPRQITSHKFGIKLKGGGVMEGLSSIMPHDGSTIVEPRSYESTIRLPLIGISLRSKATEDVLKSDKAFRGRLYTLISYAQSSKAIGYNRPFDHPLIALMAQNMERSSDSMFGSGMGMRFSRGAAGKSDFVEKHPEELLRIFSPYKQNFEKFGANVLSLESASKRFGTRVGGIDLSMVTSSGTPGLYEDILKLDLFNDSINQGFFIDLGAEVSMPVKAKTPLQLDKEAKIRPGQLFQDPENYVRSRYVYIPRGKILAERFLQGAEGSPVSLDRGDILHSIIGLISSGKHGLHQEGRYATTAARFATELSRGYARMGGKKGMLEDKFYSASWDSGATRARIVPSVMDKASFNAFRASQGKTITFDTFTVGVSEDLIRSTIKDADSAEELITRLKGGGTVYGAVHPNPVHSIPHLQPVRLKLEPSLAGYNSKEPAMSLSGFLEWLINRDNDKDVGDLLIIDKLAEEDLKNLGFENPKKALDKLFLENVHRSGGIYQDYRKSLKNTSLALQDIGKPLSNADIVKRFSALLSFGRIPSLPFVAQYPTFALADLLTQDRSPTELSEILSSVVENERINITKPFQPKDIAYYAKKMGGRKGLAKADIYHMSMNQAAIKKGGEYVPMLIDNYLSLQNQANIAYDAAAATGDIEAGFNQFLKNTTTKIHEFMEALGADYQIHSSLTDRAAARREAAETLSNVVATMTWARARHFERYSGKNFPKGFPDRAREALHATTGALNKIHNWFFPEDKFKDIGRDSLEELTESQRLAVDANAADIPDGIDKTTKETTRQVRNFFFKHWRPIGITVGVLAAAKVAADMLSDDYLEPPAPQGMPQQRQLPPEPMVSSNPAGPYQKHRNVAYVMPNDGWYSYDEVNGTSNSVNINNVRSVAARNMSSLNNLHSNISVQDSRSFKSNYQIANMTNMYEDSDYIHPYMGEA